MTRRRWILLCLLAVLLVAGLVLRWAASPETLVPALLAKAGSALGLEITADSDSDYRLGASPQLVVRNLVAREPGAAQPVLRAERLFVSVPWATLRARGQDLTATRIELDAPVLDLAALGAWQAKRPPSDTPIPNLSRGLRVVRGRVVGDGWRVEDLALDVPSLSANTALRMHSSGRYAGGELSVPFDVHASATRPAAGAGIGVVGRVSIEQDNLKLPSQVKLSARLAGKGESGLRNVVLGARSTYQATDTSLPFAWGVAGNVDSRDGAVVAAPLGLATVGEGVVPGLRAAGDARLDDGLALNLEGAIAQWPSAWPALPPPLGQSTSPLDFALGYDGPLDFSAEASLSLTRDDTRLDARFVLGSLVDWIGAPAGGAPLPPLDGTLSTPRLEISGAVLEGVEVELDDESIAPVAPLQTTPPH